jgi:hypothetical protein
MLSMPAYANLIEDFAIFEFGLTVVLHYCYFIIVIGRRMVRNSATVDNSSAAVDLKKSVTLACHKHCFITHSEFVRDIQSHYEA